MIERERERPPSHLIRHKPWDSGRSNDTVFMTLIFFTCPSVSGAALIRGRQDGKEHKEYPHKESKGPLTQRFKSPESFPGGASLVYFPGQEPPHQGFAGGIPTGESVFLSLLLVCGGHTSSCSGSRCWRLQLRWTLLW